MVRQADLATPVSGPAVLGVQPLLGPVGEVAQIVAGEPGQCGFVVGVVAGVLIARSYLRVGSPEPLSSPPVTVVDHQRSLCKLAQVIARGSAVGMQHGCQPVSYTHLRAHE